MNTLLKKLKSRKLWVTISTGAIITLGDHLGLDKETITKLAGLAASYVLGQGIADAGSQGK